MGWTRCPPTCAMATSTSSSTEPPTPFESTAGQRASAISEHARRSPRPGRSSARPRPADTVPQPRPGSSEENTCRPAGGRYESLPGTPPVGGGAQAHSAAPLSAPASQLAAALDGIHVELCGTRLDVLLEHLDRHVGRVFDGGDAPSGGPTPLAPGSCADRLFLCFSHGVTLPGSQPTEAGVVSSSAIGTSGR